MKCFRVLCVGWLLLWCSVQLVLAQAMDPRSRGSSARSQGLAVEPVMSISQAQRSLKILGFDPGPIDGIWGSQTKHALQQFQKQQGLPVTGKLDPRTENALLKAVLEAIRKSWERPNFLLCRSNAKVSRDYGFTVKAWSGQKEHDLSPDKPFEIILDRNTQRFGGQFYLRDKVFSSLETQAPTVVSITRYKDGSDQAAEFKAVVVSSTEDAVFLVWKNPFKNKVWLAIVDLTHRKAIVTHVAQGATGLVGELETLDCQ